MINLYPIIMKLEQLAENTNGKGISLPNMLRELADFREYDLHKIITDLYQAQKDADEMYEELKSLQTELEIYAPDGPNILKYEHDQAVERGEVA